MIITLSPAKIMSFGKNPSTGHTKPLFTSQRDEIAKLLAQLSLEEIMKQMKISAKQAHEVMTYIHGFGTQNNPEGMAAYSYNGMAYKGLDFSSLPAKTQEYAQSHLLIASALYGFLRPLDMIQPYRLDFLTPLQNSKGETLYAFWQQTLSAFLSVKLQEDDGIWLNLSSGEYTSIINPKLLPKDSQVITPSFKEEKNGKYRQVIVHTKKARGLMARFVLEHEITNPEHLSAFNYEGYCYAPHLSNKQSPVFIR